MRYKVLPLWFVAAASLAGCLPSADFKVTLRVIDEETGRPIPGAWVFVTAYVQAEPPFEPPYNRPLAGMRAMTNAKGIARLKDLRGLSFRGEPQDKLWKMLESREGEPKKRRISGIEGGSLFVLARGYGALSRPFGVKDSPAYQEKLRKHGRYEGLIRMGAKGEAQPVELTYRQLLEGASVTLRMKKPADPDHLMASFCPETLGILAWAPTSGKTGASMREKRLIYDFIMQGVADLGEKAFEKCGHSRPSDMAKPAFEKDFMAHELGQGTNHDTTVHLWITRQALGLLDSRYEEVKQYGADILKGVEAEDEESRPLNHFYNPHDPDNAMPLGEQALKWAAIGYPDNPRNDWDWQDALRHYREGDKKRAYKTLGHVLHLLEDLGVPMHTHMIAHHYQMQPQEARFETFFAGIAARYNGMLPPVYSMEAKAPKVVGALKDHFNGLAALTFGAHAVDRQLVDYTACYQWERGGLGRQVKEPEDWTLELMGRHLLPKAIEHSAGLLVHFHDTLHPVALVQVTKGEAKSDAIEAGGNNNKGKPIADLLAACKIADTIERKMACKELRRTAPDSERDVDALIEAVVHGDERIRKVAASALGNVAPAATHLGRKCMALLDQTDEQIQLLGIRMCGQLKAKEAVPKIRGVLRGRPRYKFSKTVGSDGKRTYDFGGANLGTIEVAQAAATALVELGDIDSIVEILSRDELMILGSGASLVARFGVRAIPNAVEAVHRKDSLRSDAARGVISTMRDEAAIPDMIALLRDKEIASDAALALSEMPVSNEKNKILIVDALATALKDGNKHVRGSAYAGLLRLNPKKYLPQAMEAIKTDRYVRLDVFYALMRHPALDAVPYLEDFIKSDELKHPNSTNQRSVAAQAIFRMTGRRVPYKGVEGDRRLYPDPYEPNK